MQRARDTLKLVVMVAAVLMTGALAPEMAGAQTSQPDRHSGATKRTEGADRLLRRSIEKAEGQEDAHARQDDAARKQAILAGPEVGAQVQVEDAVRSTFDGGIRGNGVIAVPPRRWLALLRKVELTDSQKQEVLRIQRAYAQRAKAFREQHGERLQTLNRKRQESRVDEAQFRPKDAAELRSLYQMSPKYDEAQAEIWNLLSIAQQSVFREALERERTRIERRRARDERQNDARTDDTMLATSSRDDGVRADEAMMTDDEAASRRGRVTLDEAGTRRLRFLRTRQRYRERGAPPTKQDRVFEFDGVDDRGAGDEVDKDDDVDAGELI